MQTSKVVNIEESWKRELAEEFDKDYMKSLRQFLASEIKKGKIIYPHGKDIFSAFNLTPFDKTRVVIIGQDPYHGPNQAHGLCFSVRPGVKVPPSLQNIYKELNSDLGLQIPNHGFLESWAKQGVLMINNVLTVQKGMAGSHHNQGWEMFTNRVIEILNQKKEKLIFVLWGSPAQRKGSIVDSKKHYILKSSHPSPLSAYRGFLGSKPFSKINKILAEENLGSINWSLPMDV